MGRLPCTLIPSSSDLSSRLIATMLPIGPTTLVHASLSSPPAPPKLAPHSIQLTITPSQHHSPAEAPQQPDPADHSGRAQWLRAAVLGANDGLVSVASLMIGVGAVNTTAMAMLVAGLAGLVAGACSMAIGEFVSVHAQYDMELAQMKRDREEATGMATNISEEERESLPRPLRAAAASSSAFAIGALLPLLAGTFIECWAARLAVVCGAASLGLAGFGGAAALLGRSESVRTSALRVLVGGWAAMAISYGVLRLFNLALGTKAKAFY